MKRIAVKKIGVNAFAKVIGTASALIGLVVGTITTIAYFVGASAQNAATDELFGVGAGIAAIAILIYPLILFVFGWIYGAVLAWFINIVLRQSQSGILLDIEERK